MMSVGLVVNLSFWPLADIPFSIADVCFLGVKQISK